MRRYFHIAIVHVKELDRLIAEKAKVIASKDPQQCKSLARQLAACLKGDTSVEDEDLILNACRVLERYAKTFEDELHARLHAAKIQAFNELVQQAEQESLQRIAAEKERLARREAEFAAFIAKNYA